MCYLCGEELVEVGADEVDDAFGGARQRHAADHQHRQHEVGERRREVGHLQQRAPCVVIVQELCAVPPAKIVKLLL